MPVLTYQVNAPCYGGINPKLVYIFTDDPIAVVTAPNYINWMANGQGIYTGDVALVITQENPASILAANFYEFERIGTTTNWNLVPISGSIGVASVTGTLHEIVASPSTGNVIISIASDPRLPGTGSAALPSGNTAQRAGIAGSIRFNTQLTQFEVTLDGINWIPLQTGAPSAVTSIIGTPNEIVASSPTGNVTISIADNAHLPGTAEVVLPAGNTAARGSIAGGLRFNNQTNVVELTNDGINWYTVSTSNDTVNSVSGTANRITVTGTNNVVVDIANTYVGQTSITTLGTITTGTWNATPITVPFGGTGDTSFNAYSVICAGTTNTGALQNVSGVGTSGQVLTSNGAGSLPTWQPAPGAGAGALFWITYSPTLGILDSFGVSSASHPGAGLLTINFTTPFTDNYCVQVSVAPIASVSPWGVNSSGGSSVTVKNGFAVGQDPGLWYVCAFGTQ